MNDHHNALPAGYRLGEYEIQTVLGSGGFGVTYKAHDHNLDKLVAIKEYLPPDFAVRDGRTTVKPKSSANKDDYEWGLDRFLDEARTLARFDHPHVNKVYRFFKENGTAYLVLEYIEGDLLSDLLKDKGRFNEAGLRRMIDELLGGLDAVHNAGYIHRDIKPANIIFRRDGSVVLLDFGAARQAIGQRSQMITSILTRGYAPVEQYLDTVDAMGAWSDLYSLGVVAYRCLVGGDESVLIDAPSRAHLLRKGETDKDMPPAAQVGKGKYSDDLLKAIDWAMQVEEGDRPQSVGELLAALDGEVEVVATAPVAKKTEKKATQKVRAKRAVEADQTKWVESSAWAVSVVVLGLGLAAAVVFGVSQYEQWQEERIAEAVRVEQQRKIAAALKNEKDAFRRLVGQDASPRQVWDSGTTDLHIAAAQGWAKLAQWLIENGASVHARIKSDGEEMGTTLKKRLEWSGWARLGQYPLHFAIGNSDVAAAKVLIENGAGVNATDTWGRISLHDVAWYGRKKMARFLLNKGANVNVQDKYGRTPLDIAIDEEHRDMQSLLRGRGGKCNKSCN